VIPLVSATIAADRQSSSEALMMLAFSPGGYRQLSVRSKGR
jgi:hypothetical protein